METGEFHLEQGLCFKRMDSDSTVRIRKYEQPMPSEGNPNVEFEAFIDDSSWASTIASVSNRGEDADTWEEAMNYHNRTDYLKQTNNE